MKRQVILLFVLSLCTANLELILPEEMRSHFKYNQKPGNISYSVSTFGSIPYTDKEYIQLLSPGPDNVLGCKPLVRPAHINKTDRIVWLVKRGECTYSKKAFLAQQSGAYAVLVYHNNPNIDVNNVIPCSDSVCNVIRQQPENTDRFGFFGGRTDPQKLD